MPVSRLTTTGPSGVLSEGFSIIESDSRQAAPGQGLADLLLLGSLACQAPAAVLSVPQPGGGWSTLSQGFDQRVGLNDGLLFEALSASVGPVELTDLVTSVPRSPLVQAPHSMRWAYGVGLRDSTGMVCAVVAVLDRWVRQLTKREQRAMLALSRQVSAQLVQLRRPSEAADGVPVLRKVPASKPAAASAGASAPAPTSTSTSASISTSTATSASAPASRPGRSPEPDGDTPQLLRSHEVATIFDVTERTVINWASAGKLPSLRTIGGHLRFRRDDVMRLLSGASNMHH